MVQFHSEMVTDHIRRIRSMPAVCMYLVEGSEKALLLDTGCGEVGLREYVEQLLQGKPYEVLLTHGHVDHASGAGEFERVWLHPADWTLVKQHCTLEKRLTYWEHCRPILGDTAVPAESEFVPQRTKPFLPLEDGQRFPLGGITVQAVQVPGHTHGIMVPFALEEGVAFFGDACGTGTLLVGAESTTVETYHAALVHLKKTAPKFNRVLRQHGSCESKISILDENIEVCERILAGTDDAIPHKFMGQPCRRAMRIDPVTRVRVDGKEGNIVYCPERVR